MAPQQDGGEHEGSGLETSQYTEEQLSKLLEPPYNTQEVRESTGSAENEPINNLQEKEAPEADDGIDDDRYFEAAEHESVVFGVKLRNIHGVEIPATDHECWSVKASNGTWGIFRPSKQVKLTFGRIIALAGDFYSSHSDDNRTPICGAFFAEQLDLKTPVGWQAATGRFRSAVRSLKEDTDRNLVQISDLMEQENHGVEEAEKRAEKRDPNDPIHTISNAYHTHDCGIPTNSQWWKATVGFKNPSSGLYAWLSYINADHFGDDALIAYKVGHSEAMRLAREAGKKSSDNDKSAGLQDAYVHEAFALHYLTDMFSSGHLRTPRRELHNSNYTEQSLAAAAMITGNGEVPIWDFQANYMHDNDSDTGLLVQNLLGQQWLCYGDKQFKESWDIVNRIRIMHAIQASVNELYEDAFVRQTEKSPVDFNAAKLVPQPMLAAGQGPLTSWKSQWGGYDMHNTAPLWQVNSEGDKSAWTIRANIEDHSLFGRRQATPQTSGTKLGVPEASQDCWNVRNSSFRTQGSAPTARPIDGLSSGGFLQIQDLSPGGNRLQSCVNFWGPVTVGIYNKNGTQEDHDTFTLRNRVVDFDSYDQLDTIQPLHATKWHDGNELALYRLVLNKAGGKDRVTLSGWTVRERSSSTASGEPVKFAPDQSWAFSTTSRFKDVQVAELDSNSTHANLTRLLVGNFTGQDSGDVIILKFDTSAPLETSLVTKGGELKLSSAVSDAKGVYTFAKALKTGNLDRILLASFEDKGGSTNIVLDTLDVSGQAPVTTKHQASIQASQPTNKSILVGDLTRSGNDQALVLLDSLNELTVSVNQFGSDGLHETIQKRIPQNLAAYPLIRPFFNALIPSEDPATSDGLSLLQVSLHAINQKPHLIFRLTDTATWKTETSAPVEDTLASDPHYFHIKWLRCSRTADLQYSTANALLEVFSFYGVLGIRLFAPTDERALADYQEIGRLQYMAQTSIGTGLGAEGDWGNGILTLGVKENDFTDVVYWTPGASGRIGEGNWGMSAADVHRPLVRGWEVTARPGYKA